MSRFDSFLAKTGWYDDVAWNAVQDACWSVFGEDGITLRRERYAPFFQRMGAGVRIDQGCRFSHPWRIAFDDGVRINREVIMEGSSAIHVGRNVRIGHRVFIHSANHDVSSEGTDAYFERPHIFQPVSIGDNVLISANVTILPGASIPSGSFVAAGAVVTARRFAGPVKLAGVPARQLNGGMENDAVSPQPSPELIFVAPRGDRRTLEALKLLATVLACPQVAVIADDSPVPASVRAAIAFNGAEVAAAATIPIFRVTRGQETEGARRSDGPAQIEREYVINGFGCARTLANTAAATYFYAANAYIKAPAEKRNTLVGEWATCLAMALLEAEPASVWREALDRLGVLDQKPGTGGYSAATLEAMIKRELSRLNAPLAAAFFDHPSEADFSKVQALFHGAPHLLPLWSWQHRVRNPKICSAFMAFMQPHMDNGIRLAALGCAYAIAAKGEEARLIVDTLLSERWRIDESCLIRALPGLNSLAIQPVVAALMIWALSREPGMHSVVPQRQRFRLSWQAVAPSTSDGQNLLSRGLFDRHNRLISISLLENWLKLQELPTVGEAHYYLADIAYHDLCTRIETAWSEILREALFAAGCPYLRLRPWPHGYAFAFSARYDVDREIEASQASNILRIQKEWLNSPCGSWYFFDKAAFNPRVRDMLRGWNQEDARHSCRPADACAGVGATAHSGPDSEYWRGQATAEGLIAAGATYGEGMLARWSVARPGWLGDQRSKLWLTPLHFPLEGAIVEKTTEYFDQRLEAFRSQIAAGGHVIIGTHPDCNQDILDEVLGREDLSRAWAVTVGVALERCRSVLEYESICVVDSGADPQLRTLVSKETIADLALDIWFPGQTTPHTISTQLNANVPRPVRILAADAAT